MKRLRELFESIVFARMQPGGRPGLMQRMGWLGPLLKPMERLMCSLVSANNDETVFPDAARFDVTRRPNPHVAFGYGPHQCLGQHIAKLEMRALFEELLPRIGTIELTADPGLKRGNFVTGVKKLPIRLTRP